MLSASRSSGMCHKQTPSTSPPCPLPSPTESLPSARQPHRATGHGEATEAKLGGFSSPTQDVSGAVGSARNDTTTAWAQGDEGETKCPMPGMLMIVALGSTAAAFAPARDVSVSKLPEMRSVGILLATGWCTASGAAGTFRASRRSSSLKYAQLPIPSRCIEAGW